MSEHVLRAALELAAEGLAVFPCLPSKAPATSHGFQDASTDPDTVRWLWREHPGELIGVATGSASGIDALDIDRKHDAARAWLQENRHRLPETRVHRTRSGGLHLLFQHHGLIRCSAAKLALGVDTRATGGYIIHWPSAGFPILSDAAPAPWPEWLVAALQPKPPKLVQLTPIRDISALHGERRLAALVRIVALAPEGQRNSLTFWAACRCAEMIAAGEIGADFALAVLIEAAARSGLPRHEAERTARSGIKRANR